MTLPPDRPATPDGLFLWIMHRFGEVFADHAVLNGGMALRLFDCPRSTVDVDYVFAPYGSKRDVAEAIEATLDELEDAEVDVKVHSKMLRAHVRLDDAEVVVEVNVAPECPSVPVGTAALAASLGRPSQVVRVMQADVALSHELAAWNERRLHRDLYDVYFLRTRLGASPDPAVLDERLRRVQSRRPGVPRSTTRERFAGELREAAETLDDAGLREELGALLPDTELAGLAPRIRAAVIGIAERL